jgi:hypothetical protein
MALSLGTLSAYSYEMTAPIFETALLGDSSTDLLTKVPGIKSSAKIPVFDSTAPAQSGNGCNPTSSGTTSITQTTLSTVDFSVEEHICLKDLEAYFTQAYLPGGAKPETTELLDRIVNRKLAYIAKNVARTLFQGKTTYTNSTWLKLMNGYVSLIDTAGTAVAATSQADVTTSTVRGIVEEMIFQKIPSRVLGKNPVLAMGMENFRVLLQKLWADNLYHYIPGARENNTMELIYPGSNVKVVGIQALNNDNDIVETGVLPTAVNDRMIAFDKENFVFGFDQENDLSDFDVFFDKTSRKLKFFLAGRIGVAIHDYTAVAQYKNT